MSYEETVGEVKTDRYREYENLWNVNEVQHASNHHDYSDIILEGLHTFRLIKFYINFYKGGIKMKNFFFSNVGGLNEKIHWY